MAETPNKDLSIERQITDIADNFPIFSCFDCGAAIKNFLVKQRIPGKQILLSTGSTQKPFCNIYWAKYIYQWQAYCNCRLDSLAERLRQRWTRADI
jgi:Papain fold toxin 2